MTESQITIRFAGDSGDGIQLTGDRLAKISAIFGNEVSTLADYPAEIRAPQGTLYGVSGYQLQIGTRDVYTPGDAVDILIAMNPAALKANLERVRKGGRIIVDKDSFTDKNLEKIGLTSNPLEDGSLTDYEVNSIEITEQTKKSLEQTGLKPKEAMRCKNFFALGIVCWLLDRPVDSTKEWIKQKFSKIPSIAEANVIAFNEGYTAGLVRELLPVQSPINLREEKLEPGNYRFVTGNTALATGLVSASVKAQKKLFFGAYPITPASDILHELAKHRNFGVTTYQAEDEMAAAGSAVGASYAGNLAVTSTSGPGFALKAEFLGLAVMTELPLVVIDVQRAGPSTGMPTKTEQSDLALALWGRNGEAPTIVIAPKSPSDCFAAAYEACELAMQTMTPVVLLSDAYLANGYETWKIPKSKDLRPIEISKPKSPEGFKPYERNENLSRSWVYPGMAGFEHRIGGLEKEEGTGNVCYTPENHQKMTDIRREKIQKVANRLPKIEVEGDPSSDTLIVGWGSTYGTIKKVVQGVNSSKSGSIKNLANIHLRYLNPFNSHLEEIFSKYKNIIVVENNSGQAIIKLRHEFSNIDFKGVNQINGQPFSIDGLTRKIEQTI
jgi:2-oxoglutarate ferredoxin oxidoreductase subunit alpha